MRAKRSLAALLAASFLAATSLAYVHLALSPHDYCVQHGQFEEREGVPHEREGDSPIPSENTHHHGCQWMALVSSPLEANASTVPSEPSWDEHPLRVSPLSADDPAPAPTFRMAPKASPPVLLAS